MIGSPQVFRSSRCVVQRQLLFISQFLLGSRCPSRSAVTKYYGRYPVPYAIVRVESIEGDRIGSGKTFGSLDGGVIRIAVGRTTTQEHLDADWMMTHEMVHLAFPSVPDQHHWIEEGMATYVEPIARV